MYVTMALWTLADSRGHYLEWNGALHSWYTQELHIYIQS